MMSYLGLGANIGHPAQQLAAAISALACSDGITLKRVSSVYRTRPVGVTDQPDFLNMVIAIETDIAPSALLGVVAGIEGQLGRVRGIKDGPRTLDVDILLYGDLIMDEPDLQLPHPRMRQRQFVLAPLSGIAPGLVLPDGTAVADLADENCPQVRKLGPLGPLVISTRRAPEVSADAW